MTVETDISHNSIHIRFIPMRQSSVEGKEGSGRRGWGDPLDGDICYRKQPVDGRSISVLRLSGDDIRAELVVNVHQGVLATRLIPARVWGLYANKGELVQFDTDGETYIIDNRFMYPEYKPRHFQSLEPFLMYADIFREDIHLENDEDTEGEVTTIYAFTDGEPDLTEVDEDTREERERDLDAVFEIDLPNFGEEARYKKLLYEQRSPVLFRRQGY